MKDVKVEIKGLKEVQDAIRAYEGDITRQLGTIVNAAALESIKDVKKMMAEVKTGKEYKRGSIVHKASAPGEAPAVDTGTLINSIYSEDRGYLSKAIGSRLPYAYFLEFGTFRIAPRKAWLPAVENATPKMLKRVKVAIEKAKARAEKTTK